MSDDTRRPDPRRLPAELKRQFGTVTTRLNEGVRAIKESDRRRGLTVASIDVAQRVLGRAQRYLDTLSARQQSAGGAPTTRVDPAAPTGSSDASEPSGASASSTTTAQSS